MDRNPSQAKVPPFLPPSPAGRCYQGSHLTLTLAKRLSSHLLDVLASVPVFSGHRPGTPLLGPCQLDLFLPSLLSLHQLDFSAALKCSFFHVSRPLHMPCSLPRAHRSSPYELLFLQQSLNPKVPFLRWSPLPRLRLLPQPGNYRRAGRRGLALENTMKNSVENA